MKLWIFEVGNMTPRSLKMCPNSSGPVTSTSSQTEAKEGISRSWLRCSHLSLRIPTSCLKTAKKWCLKPSTALMIKDITGAQPWQQKQRSTQAKRLGGEIRQKGRLKESWCPSWALKRRWKTSTILILMKFRNRGNINRPIIPKMSWSWILKVKRDWRLGIFWGHQLRKRRSIWKWTPSHYNPLMKGRQKTRG